MFSTIKSKFIILSLVVIIMSIGIPVGFLISQINKNFHDRSVMMVEATIDLLIDGLNDSMMRGDQKSVQELVESIAQRNSIDHVRIFNEIGLIRYSDNPSEIGKTIDIVQPGHVERSIKDIKHRDVYLERNTNVYKAIQPIEIQERCQTCHSSNKIISYLDVDTQFTKAEMKFYTGSFHMIFLGTVLILILVLGFFYLFNKFINRPLNNFMVALDAVEQGNLDMRLPIEGKDEFSILNNHYNRMVEELRDSREKIEEMHFDQLQRADKMVTLGELTASMAHDINNHSAIIMSRADYLLFESENNSSLNKFNEDLEVINNQINKISSITGRILKHSKKSSKEFVDLDLVKLVETSLDMIEPLIKKKKIILKREIKMHEAFISGDPAQLEQVILNLVSNAYDALMENGEIIIILQKNGEGKIQLIIRDNGIGVDEDTIGKIFSPFFTKKSDDKGTGLGLFIVQNICNSHNANIICESKINMGTAFIITFNGGSSK